MRDQTVSVKHGWIIIFLLNSENGLRKLMPQHFFCETLFIPRRGEGSPFRDPSPLGPSGNRERVFFVGRCTGLINSSRSDIF